MPRARPHRPYLPAGTERAVYRRWERAGAFRPPEKPRRGHKPFVIVIPPPNITGSLHMGHALQSTLMDILTRYHRMRGDDTLWLPGTDHAGIATQNVVERELRTEGKTRHDLGREKFLERVWAWKEQYGRAITEQLRDLGCSCDWTRERFTLDPAYARAVNEAFIHYAHKGLLARGDRIVNWCPRCTSAVSDLEVAYREEDATLYTITYGPLALATVRPETKFGDTGVAVHPKDSRYQPYVGKEIEIDTVIGPTKIRVVADEAVDPTFGTGVVKVTPAHDFTDFEIGERHGLPSRRVIGFDGRMNERAGPFAGMTVQEARAAVVTALREKGLLVKEEPYRHSVATCARCGTTIEPLLSKQWFVKMAPLAKPAIEVVEQGLITFHPPRWRAVYLHWLRGVKDWCISRQLWWGHRIPAWHCRAGMQHETSDAEPGARHVLFVGGTKFSLSGAGGHITVALARPKRCPECGCEELTADPDVLDTWFSSALWPFAALGWPEATADLKRFYPTSVLTTAQEILQLWVARMVFSGREFMSRKTYLPARLYGKTNAARQIPFRDVLIHQTVLNLRGERMSKSLGTGVDPLDLIKRYGADATRCGLLLQTQRDQQALRFDEEAVRTGRNVVNKLWNIGRFLQGQGARAMGHGRRAQQRPHPKPPAPTPFDQWILDRLSSVTKEVTDALGTYRFGDAMRALHAFLWDEFADWYVEASKVLGVTTPEVSSNAYATLLRLLHPFIPFVTEELWKRTGRPGLLILEPWPAAARRTEPRRSAPAARAHVRRFQGFVRDLRAARALLGLPGSHTMRIRLQGARLPRALVPALEALAGCQTGAAADHWVPLPTRGDAVVALDRRDLAGVHLPSRLRAAHARADATRARVQSLLERLARMRGKAPAEAVTKLTAVIADERRAHDRAEAARAALETIAREAPKKREVPRSP